MNKPPIELGPADALLTEGRRRAKKDQVPLMMALKNHIVEILKNVEAAPQGEYDEKIEKDL